MRTLLEQSLELPIPERIKLVEEIWDSIAAVPEAVKSSDAQLAELERRIKDHENDPSRALPWDNVKNRLRQIA